MLCSRRRLKNMWVTASRCRKIQHGGIYVFFFALLLAPFIVFGNGEIHSKDSGSGVFGLDPDLVKLLFFLLFSFAVWILKKGVDRFIRYLDALYNNQLEMNRALTQVITLHGANHKQDIELPKITDPRGAEGE